MTRPVPSNHRELFESYVKSISNNLEPKTLGERLVLLVDLRGFNELIGYMREQHARAAEREEMGL